ncbi:MAG: hypothetical protein U5R31_13555 [Acidimicrobiia bacterium]|nr:hypothetical protein [Acidimicrobiia bacterium]
MADRAFHYRWTWSLRATPEQLWPLVADTHRFDRDAGLPALRRLDEGDPLPNARCRVRLRQFGVPLEYVQEPFEWRRPRRRAVRRHFTRGPLAELSIDVELRPRPAGGTEVVLRAACPPALRADGPGGARAGRLGPGPPLRPPVPALRRARGAG